MEEENEETAVPEDAPKVEIVENVEAVEQVEQEQELVENVAPEENVIVVEAVEEVKKPEGVFIFNSTCTLNSLYVYSFYCLYRIIVK